MKAKNILARVGVRPQKSRGQNFVTNPEAIAKIIEFAKPQAEETIIEIGPGLGALTEALAQVATLSVIEIEPEFCSLLRAKFPGIKVYNADVRLFDFAAVGKDLTVFGNIPYSFSSEIVLKLLASRASIKRVVLMLQKEFAQRLAAKPGTKAYGSLSVACQLWAETRIGPIISGTSFHPRANVDSLLIEFLFLPEPRVPVPDPAWFERVVRACFTERRKQLKNSLRASGQFPVELINQALDAANIDPMRRAETLTIEEFANLAAQLKN